MTRSVSPQLEAVALAAAERRVRRDVEELGTERARRSPLAVLAASALLFAVSFALRLVIDDPGALIANFYIVPIALIAAELGTRAGIAASLFAILLVWAWGQVQSIDIAPIGYITRGGAFLLVAALVGEYAGRLRADVRERRRAEHEWSLRADELEEANHLLARTVLRLEAFTEIARAVEGTTDLQQVIALILDRARGIVDARAMLIWLREGDELVVAAETGQPGSGEERRQPIGGSRVGEVLRSGRSRRIAAGQAPGFAGSAGLLVPLAFRGETFGVMGALDGGSRGHLFDDELEAVMQSIAASAATAVATARSVAEERLRDGIAAADEARARWARELHDETLQGLGGLRMMLSSALRSGSPEALRRASERALEQTKLEIQGLRRLIAELRPAALDELGLGPAIETLADRSAPVDGLHVTTRIALDGVDGEGGRLPADAENAIYRVVQEALMNVEKHAGAENVKVEVCKRGAAIEVVVSDDGQGFDPERVSGGFGLIGMRERMDLVGGTLEIASSPGGSTSIRALMPAVGPP